MNELAAVDVGRIMRGIAQSTAPVSILWQTPDSVAFVARGREGRSQFHVDPGDEVMLMLRGEMALHYLTPDGQQKVARVVADYREDPVSRVYEEFYGSERRRACGACGHVTAHPG